MAEVERRVPGRVSLRDHFPDREAFSQLLRDVDVFVHPNPHEPFGLTPLEAMASGLPLVAPRAGGVLSYANDGNAWLCPPAAEAFAAAVPTIFADDHERRRRLYHARTTAEQHDWNLIARRYFELIDSLHYSRVGVTARPLSAA